MQVDLTEKETEKILQLVLKSLNTNRYELKKVDIGSEKYQHIVNSTNLKSNIVKKLCNAIKEFK